jgi:hypothetical protein
MMPAIWKHCVMNVIHGRPHSKTDAGVIMVRGMGVQNIGALHSEPVAWQRVCTREIGGRGGKNGTGSYPRINIGGV